MEGTVSGPYGDWRYTPEVIVEDSDLHNVLLQRAREAIAAARRTVAHSLELAWLGGEHEEGAVAARCAWCERYRVGASWLDVRVTPPNPDKTTHTICDDCTLALRQAGLSA